MRTGVLVRFRPLVRSRPWPSDSDSHCLGGAYLCAQQLRCVTGRSYDDSAGSDPRTYNDPPLGGDWSAGHDSGETGRRCSASDTLRPRSKGPTRPRCSGGLPNRCGFDCGGSAIGVGVGTMPAAAICLAVVTLCSASSRFPGLAACPPTCSKVSKPTTWAALRRIAGQLVMSLVVNRAQAASQNTRAYTASRPYPLSMALQAIGSRRTSATAPK